MRAFNRITQAAPTRQRAPAADACSWDGDCPDCHSCEEYFNQGNVCVMDQECAEDSHCASGEECVDCSCQPVDDGGGGCTTALDCSGDQVCSGGECVECAISGDCGSDLACDPDTNTCVECEYNHQCPDGYDCENNSCIEDPNSCSTDSDCGPCQKCYGECVGFGDCSSDGDCASNESCVDCFCEPDSPTDPDPDPSPSGSVTVESCDISGSSTTPADTMVSLSVQVSNTYSSSKTRTISAFVGGAFVGQASVTVPGGNTVSQTVTFTPASAGVSDGTHDVSVELS